MLDWNTSEKHPALSAQFVKNLAERMEPWVDAKLVEMLVTRHHESTQHFPDEMLAQKAPEPSRPLCLLVSRADNYSAAEREEKGSEAVANFKRVPLASVFSRLQLRKDTQPPIKGYRPAVFSLNQAFAADIQELNPSQTAAYLKTFGSSVEEVFAQKSASFDTVIHHLLTVLENYSWCLPASTQDALPDISLYDHLRTTAAIAAVLYQYHDSANDFSERMVKNDDIEKFLLVAGDISGIQRYIFDITNTGVGGVAKRLRARSFFLTAISLGLAYKIVHDWRLPPCNILVHSGGNFFVLLPNTEKARQYVRDLGQKVNRELFTDYGGELAVNLAAVSFSGKDFRAYTSVLRKVREKLDQEKHHPLASLLIQDGGWVEEEFLLKGPEGNGRGYCACCGKLPAAVLEKGSDDEARYVCPVCASDVNIGRLLIKAKTIAFYDHEPVDRERMKLPGGLWVVVSPQVPQEKNPMVVLKLNQRDLNELMHLPAQPIFFGNHVPVNEQGVLEFDQLAKLSTGRSYLAVLKADVDNLGALFALGLGKEGTISRVSTLSRMLETFFAGWFNQLLVDKFPYIYLVYSGGDDLLAIGPWNEIIEVAQALRREFTRFTGGNPDVTLSAGIALFRPKLPVFRSVAQAEENLELSKKELAKRKKEPKDQVTLLGETVKWDDLAALVEQGQRVGAWLNENKIRSATLYRLLYYAKLFDLYYSRQETVGLRYIPLLTYDMARNIKDGDVLRWMEGLLDLNGLAIRHLPLIARYALLQRRGVDA